MLAEHSQARITAVDTDEGALARLRAKAALKKVDSRIDARCHDMARLETLQQTFDLLWAEGSGYIIGVEHALEAWRHLLEPGGLLVFSDLVWRRTAPSAELQAYWSSEYHDMTSVDQRLIQAEHAGYTVLSHLDMGQAALDAYYLPLEAKLQRLAPQLAGEGALADLHQELAAYHRANGEFGYEMFVLAR